MVQSEIITDFAAIAAKLEMSCMLNLEAGEYTGTITSPKKGIETHITPETGQTFQPFTVAKLEMILKNGTKHMVPVDPPTLLLNEGTEVTFVVSDELTDAKKKRKKVVIKSVLPVTVAV